MMKNTTHSKIKCLGLIFGCVFLLLSPESLARFDRQPGVHPSSIAPSYDNAPRPQQPAPVIQPVQDEQAVVPQTMTSPAQEYVLGVGDRIRLTVYGEKDLSGDYDVGSTGIIAMPLIGDIQAAGQPLRNFEQAVRYKLSQGYLRDPRVNAQIVNYRPFFILGEVAKPGSYPYVNGMSILNAVAMAGGYSYRADRKDVTITRADKKEEQAPETATVMPGDIIRVPERFF